MKTRIVDLYFNVEVPANIAGAVIDATNLCCTFDGDGAAPEIKETLKKAERFGGGRCYMRRTEGELTDLEFRRQTLSNERGQKKAIIALPLWALDAVLEPYDEITETLHARAWYNLSCERREALQEFLGNIYHKHGAGYITLADENKIYDGWNDVSDVIEPSLVAEFCNY